MSQNRLIITEPSGIRRSIPLVARDMTIGRSSENDIILDYVKTSRNHAIIRPEGGRYYIIDLGSSNGTYLGRTRLPANTPQPWTPDKIVSVGEVELRLELARGAAYTPEERDAMGTFVEASPFAPQKEKSSSPLFMIIMLIVFFGLCATSAIAAALAYYFLGG